MAPMRPGPAAPPRLITSMPQQTFARPPMPPNNLDIITLHSRRLHHIEINLRIVDGKIDTLSRAFKDLHRDLASQTDRNSAQIERLASTSTAQNEKLMMALKQSADVIGSAITQITELLRMDTERFSRVDTLPGSEIMSSALQLDNVHRTNAHKTKAYKTKARAARRPDRGARYELRRRNR